MTKPIASPDASVLKHNPVVKLSAAATPAERKATWATMTKAQRKAIIKATYR
jgi:hypothetical protein